MNEYLIFNSDGVLAAQCWAVDEAAAVRRMFETGKVETPYRASTWYVARQEDVDPEGDLVADGLVLPSTVKADEIFVYDGYSISISTDYRGVPIHEPEEPEPRA